MTGCVTIVVATILALAVGGPFAALIHDIDPAISEGGGLATFVGGVLLLMIVCGAFTDDRSARRRSRLPPSMCTNEELTALRRTREAAENAYKTEAARLGLGMPVSSSRVMPLPAEATRTAVAEEVRWQVWHRDGMRCRVCGTGSRLTIDHIHPVSLGGTNDESNLQTLCRSCNSRKGARFA